MPWMSVLPPHAAEKNAKTYTGLKPFYVDALDDPPYALLPSEGAHFVDQEAAQAAAAGDVNVDLSIPPKPDALPTETIASPGPLTQIAYATSFNAQAQAEACAILAPVQVPAYPVEQPDATHLRVRVRDLHFGVHLNLAVPEPLVCRLAVYDTAKFERISEDFHFELNSDRNLETLGIDAALLTRVRSAMFTINNPAPTLALVLTVSKLVSKKPSASFDLYAKGKKAKEKAISKHFSSIREHSTRIREFWSPFVWSALPLFDRSGNLLASGPGLEFTAFVRDRGDLTEISLAEAVDDMLFKDKRKKLKVLPKSALIFDLEPVDPLTLTHTVDPMGAQLVPGPKGSTASSSSALPPNGQGDEEGSVELVREILPVPFQSAPAIASYPNLNIRNSLQVLLEAADLTPASAASDGNFKNAVVKIEFRDSDAALDDPDAVLASVWGHGPSSASLVKYVYSRIMYAEKAPVFNDEFRIVLPEELTPSHHILFSHYHVIVKPKKKDPRRVILGGYSVLPLMDSVSGQLLPPDQVYTLPIASTLPNHYLRDLRAGTLPWLAGQEPLVRFKVSLSSSLYPTDVSIVRVFSHPGVSAAVAELVSGIGRVSQASGTEHFMVVADRLIELMVAFEEEVLDESTDPDLVTAALSLSYGSVAAFAALLRLVATVQGSFGSSSYGADRLPVFSLFIHSGSRRVAGSHNILLRLLGAFASNPALAKLAPVPETAWFVLELALQSLFRAGVEEEQAPLEDRTLKCIASAVKGMIGLAASSDRLLEARELTQWVAVFARELLRVAERPVVLAVFQSLFLGLGLGASSSLHAYRTKLRYSVLEVFAEFEGFLPLLFSNGVAHDDSLRSALDEASPLLQALSRTHFISTLVSASLVEILDSAHEEYPHRGLAIKAMSTVFGRLVHDARYQSGAGRQHIASAFFGLVLLLTTSHESLAKWRADAPVSQLRDVYVMVMFVLEHVGMDDLKTWLASESKATQLRFLALVADVIRAFTYDPLVNSEEENIVNDSKRALEEYYARGGAGSPGGSPGASSGPDPAKTGLRRSATMRRVGSPGGSPRSPRSPKGDAKNGPDGGGSPLRAYAMKNAVGTLTRGGSAEALMKGSPGAGGPSGDGAGDGIGLEPDVEAKRQRVMTLCVSSTVLRVMQVFFELGLHVGTTGEAGNGGGAAGGKGEGEEEGRGEGEGEGEKEEGDALVGKMLDVYVGMLRSAQSVVVYSVVYEQLRLLVSANAEVMFAIQKPYCASLSSALLPLCNVKEDGARCGAALFLYLMMKVNYGAYGNVRKCETQITVALAELISSGEAPEDTFIRMALESIAEVAAGSDGTGVSSEFSEMVVGFKDLLMTVLKNTIEISIEQRQDPVDSAQLADLYFGIVLGYMTAPELRVAWLSGLAKVHEKYENWAEAAICKCWIASTVAEALAEEDPSFLYDFRVMSRISPAYERIPSASRSDILGGLANSSEAFMESSIVSLVSVAVKYFAKAQLYELVNQAYKLLIPRLEVRGMWRLLGEVHSHLVETMGDIQRVNENRGTRVLGSYYRVGFYGPMFESLRGEGDDGSSLGIEYVYKEPPFTHLYTLTENLIQIFVASARFGSEAEVEIIKDSRPLTAEELDPGKGYVQITSLEPYHTARELSTKKTDFDLISGVSKFSFETPFTLGGKARGATRDQWKRQTILHVATPFPNLLKRSRVAETTTVELSPLEVGVDAIASRVAGLRKAAADGELKILLQLLQGSVLLQVNAGAMEIAEAFLGEDAGSGEDELDGVLLERLRVQLGLFLDACGDGLLVSKSLISLEQAPLQEEMEKGYGELRVEMEGLLA